MSIIERINTMHLAAIGSIAVVAIGAALIGIATAGAATPFMIVGVLLVSFGGCLAFAGCFGRGRRTA